VKLACPGDWHIIFAKELFLESIGIRKTRNTRNRDMAAPIVAVKNKEEQGTTMAIDTTDGQIPIGAYG
jgi:hypothetical protein